ncbi:MAG: PPC domain-containing protein, partial [Myxococcota bacterium]|nr:PPC domain-containing protein [Myxococcota bacterium]
MPAATGTTAGLRICPGDEDWFALDLEGGQTITVSLAFQHLRGDINLQIIDRNGATMIRESVTTTDGETILHPVGATGTYYVRVYGVGVWVENDYDMMLSMTAGCADDAMEPNSSAPAAAVVTMPFELTNLTICYGDEDWFAFDAELGQTLTVLARFTHSAGDLQMDIYGSDGLTLLARAASATDSESLIFVPTFSGRYYIRIWGRTPAEMTSYGLMATARGSPCTADRNEPNDSLFLATPSGSAATTALSICPGDYDYFAMAAGRGQMIVAEARFTHAEGDLHLRLYDTDGLTILAQSVTANDIERVVLPVMADGVYYLLVWGANFFQTNSYDLVLELRGTECPEDAQEPNNSFVDATPVAGTATFSGNICYGDWDYFAVDLELGQTLIAEATFTHAAGNLQLALYDIDGRTWLTGSTTSADNEAFVYLVTAPGRYFVAVYGSSFMTRNTYSLNVTVSGAACVNDRYEPNNAYVFATPAPPGSYAGQICFGDRDYYAVDLAAGQTLQAVASFVHAEGNLQLRLLDVDGVTGLAGSAGTTNTETIVFVATASGVYFLDVYPFSFATQNDYVLGIDVRGTACTPDGNEPNDSYLLATPAPATRVSAEICYGDWDWFSVAAGAGQTINAVLRFTNAAGNLDLRLYDVDGRTGLVTAATNNDVETISFTVTVSGTYYVTINGRTGLTRNSYTFDLTVTGTACTPDTLEPNDSYLTASPRPATTFSGTICPNDWDWFSVDAAAGQTINAVLRFT